VLSKHGALHEQGIWWSFPVTNVVVALVSIAWFARGTWKRTRITEEDKEVAQVTQEAMQEEGVR
jgi:Na+-driven multidrug efflux pump